MISRSRFIGIVCLALAGAAAPAFADSTFDVELHAALCPEYADGNIAFMVQYRAPGQVNLAEAPVTSKTIDTASNTGTFRFALPATYGTSPIAVTGYCAGPYGVSDASNTLNISFAEASQQQASMLSAKASGASESKVIASGAPFDPDGDGDSNHVAWRPSTRQWIIEDLGSPFVFGSPGARPFLYRSLNGSDDVGFARISSAGKFEWNFRGAGFITENNQPLLVLDLGMPGDQLVPGSWELPNVTSPAVARQNMDGWTFIFRRRNGTDGTIILEAEGSVPVPADYDGDGLFDAAAYSPAAKQLTVRYSKTGQQQNINVTGARPDTQFFVTTGRLFEFIGTSSQIPLSWQTENGEFIFTTFDPATAKRSAQHSGGAPTETVWGKAGDIQG